MNVAVKTAPMQTVQRIITTYRAIDGYEFKLIYD